MSIKKEIREIRNRREEPRLNKSSRPQIRPEAFPGICKVIADVATQNSEADPVGVLMTLLVRLSAIVGRGPYFLVGDSTHYINIYAVTVGQSSKSRKGTASAPIQRIFELIDEEEPLEVTPGPLSTGEGLIYKVRDPEYTTDQSTGEVIVKDPGVPDKRLYILADEFASALIAMSREGNSLSTTLRAFWDHGNAAPITKTTHTKTTNAHIAINGHITAVELKKQLSNSDLFNGFANRFLWAHVHRPKKVPLPDPIPQAILKEIATELSTIVEFGKKLGRMKFSNPARKYWIDQYSRLSDSDDSIAGIMTSRTEAMVPRLAMLYALLEKSKIIKRVHLKSAIAVVGYVKDSTKHIFPEKLSSIAFRIYEALCNSEKGKMSQTDIQNKVFNRNIAAEKLKKALKEMVTKGYANVKFEDSGPKKKQVFTAIIR